MRAAYDLWALLTGSMRLRNRAFWTPAFNVEAIPARVESSWRRRRLEHDRTKARASR